MDKSKIIIVQYKKYSFLGFRFGENVTSQIEVKHSKETSKFTTSIVKGPNIPNYESIFADKIEAAKNEIIKELTFSNRRKSIKKDYDTKKIQKIETDRIFKESRKSHFDEMSSRMALVRKDRLKEYTEKIRNPSEGFETPLPEPTPDISGNEYKPSGSHFGDTSKIINRRTRVD
jgi:hypothetical protein